MAVESQFPHYDAVKRVFGLQIGDVISMVSVLGTIAAHMEETNRRLASLEAGRPRKGGSNRAD